MQETNAALQLAAAETVVRDEHSERLPLRYTWKAEQPQASTASNDD